MPCLGEMTLLAHSQAVWKNRGLWGQGVSLALLGSFWTISFLCLMDSQQSWCPSCSSALYRPCSSALYRLCPLSPGTFISSHILLARKVAFFCNKAFTPKVSTWGPSTCVPPHLLDFTWCKCGQNWRILKLLLMYPWVEGLKFLNSKFYRKHIRRNAYSSCVPASISKSSVIRRDIAQACLLI